MIEPIKYLNKTCIDANVNGLANLAVCLLDYPIPYGITSSNVRYIHGSGDTLLMYCTSVGVDVYWDGYRSSTIIPGAQKCFMTSTGKFYYTVDKGNEWELNRVDNVFWDWTTPDYSYVTGSGILQEGLSINDIFVTEGTSYNKADNTLFIATSSGVVVIDEGSLTYRVYYTQ
jgi:hypothetical protein